MRTLVQRRTQRTRGAIGGERRPRVEKLVPRILFVDDDPDLHTTLEIRMRPFEVELEHAYYGTQGIAEASSKNPDLILMDLSMPNGNGEYLLETIKRNPILAGTPVIVLTGMRDPALRRQVGRLGVDGYLAKPVRFDDLVHEMGRFIDLRKAEANGDDQ